MDPFVERMTGVLDALGCGAMIFDRVGKIVFVNRMLCKMMQRRAEELVGHSLFEIYEDPQAHEVISDTLSSFEVERDTERYVPLPDGTRVPMAWSSRPLRDPETGRCDYRIVTMINISAQKSVEHFLREETRALAAMSDNAIGSALNLTDYSHLLEERVLQRTVELAEAQLDSIYMLAEACEAKDKDTGNHVRRIESYARAMARKLGFADRDASQIGVSAILHDIGKLHVPDHILNKPGPLEPDERIVIQSHTTIGEKILPQRSFFTRAREIARSHHENFDGSGYPDGRAKDEIPIAARIVHLADVYDALSTPRVYKQAWPGYRVAAVIDESVGKMFDPKVVKAFRALEAEGFFKHNGNGA